jgi:negative regulator of sigma E activity
MNTRHTETLSAFVDGEAVDIAALSAALEDGEARRALVDFVRLRGAARSDGAALPASLRQIRRALPQRRAIQWTAAAAVLAIVFVLGMLTSPLRPDGMTSDASSPPSPARVERFEPGVDWHSGN